MTVAGCSKMRRFKARTIMRNEAYFYPLLKKYFYTGCSKMHRCKARDIARNEAYFLYAAVTNNERNAADGRFSTAC
jgi:hypothetical protein